MAIQFIKYQELNEKLQNKGMKIVSFYSDTCGPCKMFAPVLEELSYDYEVYKISIDEREEVKNAGVKSVPFTRFYLDGKIINEVTGYTTKEKLIEIIEK